MCVHVRDWMVANGFQAEGELVSACSNWHHASTNSGSSQAQRKEGNEQMLHYVLDETLRWHGDNRDLSSLDIHR